MPNFLEQLVAEWYEFNGYYVRRNIRVGPRDTGGYECELDVVAFHPEKKLLVHLEPSTDGDNWNQREARFRKKFKAGERYIPRLFSSFEPLPKIDHVALFVFGSAKGHAEVGGGRVMMMRDFMREIRERIEKQSISRSAIHEQYVILRTLQYAAEFWR